MHLAPRGYPAGSQVGPFRRTSAPRDRERFTWRRILRQNAQRSVAQMRTPVRSIARSRPYVKQESKAAEADEGLISQGTCTWGLRPISLNSEELSGNISAVP